MPAPRCPKEHARDEVIVVLLGLLALYSDDLERLTVIVRHLQILPSEATAQRLFEETPTRQEQQHDPQVPFSRSGQLG
jgi:hypothetical protein